MQSSQIPPTEKIAISKEKNFSPINKQTLISAATPLLAIMMSIRNTLYYQHTEELRVNLLHIINFFETQTKASGYTNRTILTARYCLCTALDEAILSTPWGSNSILSQRSLLATVHKETWGGEKFYIIVEKMLAEPTPDSELLELFYLIISLGFEGKYFDDSYKLNYIKNNLFQLITKKREEPHLPLTPYAEIPLNTESSRVISIWLIILVTTIFCILINTLTEIAINHLTHSGINTMSHLYNQN